jgi:hypothetical protein
MQLSTEMIAGLIGHLKVHFPLMHRLYLVLKDRKERPTDDEIAIAAGKKILDPTLAADYLLQLEKASTNLENAFKQQSQRAAVSFDILPSRLSIDLTLHFTGQRVEPRRIRGTTREMDGCLRPTF